MSEKDSLVEVKISTLVAALADIEPYYYKAESLLEGHYVHDYDLDKSRILMLMELSISAMLMTDFITELLTEAENLKISTVLLKPEEALAVTGLLQTLAVAPTLSLSYNFSLSEH